MRGYARGVIVAGAVLLSVAALTGTAHALTVPTPTAPRVPTVTPQPTATVTPRPTAVPTLPPRALSVSPNPLYLNPAGAFVGNQQLTVSGQGLPPGITLQLVGHAANE